MKKQPIHLILLEVDNTVKTQHTQYIPRLNFVSLPLFNVLHN